LVFRDVVFNNGIRDASNESYLVGIISASITRNRILGEMVTSLTLMVMAILKDHSLLCESDEEFILRLTFL
jgi:hypothetical protein